MNIPRIGEIERLEVNRLIDALIEGRIPRPPNSHRMWPIGLIRASQSIPTYEDWTGFCGINRDGELVHVEEGQPISITTLNEPLFQRVALYEASRRFPSLKSLLPQRPARASVCAGCNGTGRFECGLKEKLREGSVRCVCGGLGWVLPDE